MRFTTPRQSPITLTLISALSITAFASQALASSNSSSGEMLAPEVSVATDYFSTNLALTLAGDAFLLVPGTLFVASALMSSGGDLSAAQANDSANLNWAGVSMIGLSFLHHAFSVPISHAVHGHWGRAFASLGIRLGGTLLAGVLGLLGGLAAGGSATNNGLGAVGGAGLGGAIGMGLGMFATQAIDLAVLGSDE